MAPPLALRGCAALQIARRKSVERGPVFFAALDPIGQHVKRQRFHRGDRLLAGLAVRQHSRKHGDFGDPPTVGFAVELERQNHVDQSTIASCRSHEPTSAWARPAFAIAELGVVATMRVAPAESAVTDATSTSPERTETSELGSEGTKPDPEGRERREGLWMAPLRRCGGLARVRCEVGSHRAWVDHDWSCRSFSSFWVLLDPFTSSVFRSWSGRAEQLSSASRLQRRRSPASAPPLQRRIIKSARP